MNKKSKKIIINIGLFIFALMLLVLKVRADSGFDVDFGGGGSGGGDISGIFEIFYLLIRYPIVFVIVLVIIILLAIYYSAKEKRKHNTTAMGISLFRHLELPKEQIQAILGDVDVDVLLTDRFNQFVDIQNGWMNFKYAYLREKLTDEMYNQYAMQLDTMQLKNQQNIMYDYTFFEGMITNLTKEGNKVTMTMQIVTSFFDYIMENGNVVRGKKDKKVIMLYELTFVKTLDHNGICPNCGAKLPKTNVCDYCHSVVPNSGSDWVLAKKQTLQQK